MIAKQTNEKFWISNLGLNKWMEVVDEEANVVKVFRLKEYSIIDGAIKILIEDPSGRTLETGMAELHLLPNVKVCVHTPIELHQVIGHGLSPRVVYRLPKRYKINPHVLVEKESFYDKARKHTMVIKGQACLDITK